MLQETQGSQTSNGVTPKNKTENTVQIRTENANHISTLITIKQLHIINQ